MGERVWCCMARYNKRRAMAVVQCIMSAAREDSAGEGTRPAAAGTAVPVLIIIVILGLTWLRAMQRAHVKRQKTVDRRHSPPARLATWGRLTCRSGSTTDLPQSYPSQATWDVPASTCGWRNVGPLRVATDLWLCLTAACRL
jgi:hypothetical protein